MTIHQIRIFLALAKYSSITKASQALHISEPSVYQQLKSMQTDLGRTFYCKEGRGVVLTPDGEAFHKRAAEVVEQFEQLEKQFSGKVNRSNIELLSIGGSHLFANSVLSSLIAKFKQNRPDIEVTLRIKSSSVIEASILKSKVEIGLITNSSHSPSLIEEPYRYEPVVVVVAARHRWAQKKGLTLAEFARKPMIIRDRKETNSWKILEELERKGLRLNILMRCNSAQAVKDAVMRGLGCGVLYQDHVVQEIRKGHLKVLKIEGLSNPGRQSFVVYRSRTSLSVAAQAFLDLIRQSPGSAPRLNQESTHSLLSTGGTIQSYPGHPNLT